MKQRYTHTHTHKWEVEYTTITMPTTEHILLQFVWKIQNVHGTQMFCQKYTSHTQTHT